MQNLHLSNHRVKTKSTVRIHSLVWRWSLLKTGHCVCLELASISLSLIFEKTVQMAKKLVKMIWCRYVFHHICRRNSVLISLRQNTSNHCQSILVFLTVHCDKIFKHGLESSSIRLRVSFFIAFVHKLKQFKMFKAKVNIQVLQADRRLITLLIVVHS